MTYAPTLEQFLAQTEADELEPVTVDPLDSIAESMRQLVEAVQAGAGEVQGSDWLRESYDDLEAKYADLAELVDQIEAIVKPSTSKLANSVRDAISGWRSPEVPAEIRDEPAAEQEEPSDKAPRTPAHDAEVWEWRAYARRLGHDGPDVESMNRSQIRTLLGIPHGAPGSTE